MNTAKNKTTTLFELFPLPAKKVAVLLLGGVVGVDPLHGDFAIAARKPVESTSAAVSAGPLELAMVGIEHVINATFLPPSILELQFMDGTCFSLDVRRLEVPDGIMDWSTASAAITGEKIIVRGRKGLVPIDAGTLRYLVDKNYAAELDEKLTALQFTDEELEQLDLNDPPTGFLEQSDRDLTRESWK